MTNRLMLDLETLSTRDDAAVVAIGAVLFDEEKILDSRYYPLQMGSLTGHIDPNTLSWWFEQSKEAQQATFGTARCSRYAPYLAGGDLATLVKDHDVQTVWANDPHFDVVILQNWWRRYRDEAKIMGPVGSQLEPLIAYPWPFKYNQPRSYRTLVELAKKHGFTDQMYDSAKGMYVAHCAVDDAAAQARVVIACETWLQSGGSSHQLTQRLQSGGSWQADQRPLVPSPVPTSWRARHEAENAIEHPAKGP